MAKPESQLWSKFKEGTLGLGVYWTRLETWATPGIPDVHGIKEGKSFWVELKVSKLKSLNKVDLRPHQIAWQTRYSSHGGSVWNLVAQPSSRLLKLFRGERAMELGEGTKNREELTPDWETGTPYDWKGLVDYIVSHS
jgi:hypothetical protein